MVTTAPVSRAASRKKAHFRPSYFDQGDPFDAQNGEHQPWKSGTAADIEAEFLGPGRNKRPELGRIPEMPPPGVLEGRGADEIDRLLPMPKQRVVTPKPVQCFT